MIKNAKKTYQAPKMIDFGALDQVVLNTHGDGSGDSGTEHGGSDSGWVAIEESLS